MSIATSSTWRRRREALTLEVESPRRRSRAGQRHAEDSRRPGATEPVAHTVHLDKLGAIKLWDLTHPNLYTVHVRLLRGTQAVDRSLTHHRFPRSAIHRSWFRTQRQSHQAARAGPSSDLSLRRPGHAGPRPAQRCADSPPQAEDAISCAPRTIRSRAIFSMPATKSACWCWRKFPAGSTSATKPWKLISIDNVSRMIRRDWNHPSHHPVGRAHQRVERRSRFLHSHQCAGPQTGSYPADRRHPLFSGIGIPRRCFHHERLRLSAEAAQSPALSEHRIRRPHLSHQDHRPGGTAHRTHAMRHARIHDQLASNPAIRRRHRLVRLRLQHARRFRLRRSHLLSRRHRHVPRAQAAAGFYKSQCDPAEEVVLEPAFHWARGDASIGFSKAVVCSNCDQMKFYIADELVADSRS